MKAKEYLQQVKKCEIIVRNKQREIDSLYAILKSVTGTWKEDVVQNGSSSENKMGDTIAKIVDLQAELNRDIDTLIDTKRAVLCVIERLDPIYFDLLYKRYFMFETWERIACEMGYGYQWTCKLHGRALEQVRQAIESDIKP